MGAITVRADRDSVAMGDDAVPHDREVTVPAGTMLSVLLEECRPYIRSAGWSWVAVVDTEVSAVWSVDHGVQLLVPDREVGEDDAPREVLYRYFLQVDPAWLHDQLAVGARPDPRALSKAFEPIALERAEAEERRREREVAQKLVPVEVVLALRRLGARVELHSDRLLRLDVLGERWTLRLMDTMTRVEAPDGVSVVSARPVEVAARLALVGVGEQVRTVRGLEPLPATPWRLRPRRARELRDMHPFPAGVRRWSTVEEPTVQLAGERALAWFRYADGRTTKELARLLAADLPSI